ncbi:hypothetical protein ACJRO7_021548, partial [Eucalyptus globulus]
PPAESSSLFTYDNLPDGTRRQMFNHYEKMGCPGNDWRTLTAQARQCPLNEERDADKFSPKQE